MKSKDIRKLVVDQIYQGKRRQEIFDGFNARIKGRELDIAAIVADVPTLAQRQRWQWLNMILIGLLTISILFKVLYAISLTSALGSGALLLAFIFPIVNIVLLWGVVTYRPKSYRSLGFWGLFSALQLINHWRVSTIDMWTLVDLNMVAGLIFLGFFLHGKLKGSYRVKSQTITDAQGKIRSVSTVRFDD